MKELTIAISSKHSLNWVIDESPIGEFLRSDPAIHYSYFHCNYDINCKDGNNSLGLSEMYNTHINEDNKGKIVVFVHDDVEIRLSYPALHKTLNNAINLDVDIVGIAGGHTIDYKARSLWHHMCTKRSGAVSHLSDTTNKHTKYVNVKSMHTTCFGAYPMQCDILDGLFLAVNIDRLLETNHQFDEQFKFHHYDIDFCLQAGKKGLTMSTWDIPITHYSPGLKSFEDPAWSKSDKLFCKKYSI